MLQGEGSFALRPRTLLGTAGLRLNLLRPPFLFGKLPRLLRSLPFDSLALGSLNLSCRLS